MGSFSNFCFRRGGRDTNWHEWNTNCKAERNIEHRTSNAELRKERGIAQRLPLE